MKPQSPPSPGQTRKLVESIWREVLGVAEVDPDRSFADHGGTSLGANQLVAKLSRRMGIEVPVIRIFEYPTLRQFLRFLAQGTDGGLPPQSTVTGAAADESAALPAVAGPGAAAHDIAIVGMACRFPGANSVTEFWQNLIEGRDSIRALSDEEISPAVPAPMRSDPRYVRAAGLLERPFAMDAAFFDIKPMEARLTDPQHRVLLETSFEALENAGHGPGSFAGRTAVFAGTEDNSYYKTEIVPYPEAEARAGRFSVMTGNEKDFVAMRIAHKLDLRGPAVSVHTACSTSLVAVIMACKSLRNGECDMALAGGASVHFPTPEGYYYQEGGVFSADGHCRPFDKEAQGTVFTDGVGVVVLKRLADAQRDGNTIFAVVKGGAINNDGAAKISFSAPSVSGQAACIAEALRDAAVAPETIGYVEAHGTATPVGDPIEVEGLRQAFGPLAGRRQFCGLGSVKSNIGHTTAAAGVASLIKTALALRNGLIPASLHFHAPNPALDLENSPFFVVDRNTAWQRGATPRRAGVSSFGIGGTNAHLVLEEPPAAAEQAADATPRPFEILPVSSRTAAQRDSLLQSLDHEPHSVRDLAFTLQQGRSRFKFRGAALRLPRWPHGNTEVRGTQPPLEDPCPVFLFPGQGAQYIQMGLSLSAEFPEFRQSFSRCCSLLSAELDMDFAAFIFDAANQQTLEETRFTQPALFAIEVALGRMLMDWGLHPAMMVGHSVGEFAAAHLAGVFSLEDGVRLIAARGRLMAALPRGRMLSARAPIDAVLAAAGEPIDIASINSPVHSVLAGPDALVARVQARLEAAGIACRPLHTSHAFHSRMMDPVVDPFLDFVRSVTLHVPRIPIVSTVTGQPLGDADATDPAYWARHLRATVQFSPALLRAIDEGGNLFIEVGPRSTLANLAVQHFARGTVPCAAVALLGDTPEPESEVLGIATALARIWTHGLELPWQRIWPAGRRVPCIAAYPFERQDFRFSEGRQPQQPLQPATVPQAAPLPASLPAPQSAPFAPAPVLHAGAAAATVLPIAADVLRGQLATLFADFAGMAIARADASFIEAGFDSLVLMQIGVELGKRFGVSVSLGDLMRKHNTLDRLAAHIAGSVPAGRLGLPATGAGPAAGSPALPPALLQALPPAPAVAPRTPVPAAALRAELAALFAEFAGVAISQPQDSFIESGFDSLVLMQIGVELGKKYGVSVSLGDLMRRHNTLDRLAAHLAAAAPPPPAAVPDAAAGTAQSLALPQFGDGLPSLPDGAHPMDLAQLFEFQARQMQELFQWQLRQWSAAGAVPGLAGGAFPGQAVPAPAAAVVRAMAPAAAPGATSSDSASVSASGSSPGSAPTSGGIVPRADRSVAPLTLMQERVRFTEEMYPGRNVYSISTGYRLSGEMNPALFAQALRQVIARQSALRSVVGRNADGKWEQRLQPELDYRLPYEDLSELPAEQRDAELRQQMQAIIDQPFDIQSAPLFRAALWKLGAREHVFLFVPHHLVFDGWSFDLLNDELAANYGALLRGSTPALAPLEIDYGDYAQWHGQWLASAQCAGQLAYWQDLFRDLPAPEPIATDHPRNAARSGQGHIEWLKLDTDRSERLRAIARLAGGSLSMLMTAAYAAVIHQMAGGGHVVLGIAVRGRSLPKLESVIGFFSNMLPLPVHVAPRESFLALVETVGERLAAAFDHQDVPFEMLAAEPRIAAWARHAGVPVHALMSFQDARRRPRHWGDLAAEHLVLAQHTATDDFGLWVTDRTEGIEGRLVTNADAFGPRTGALLRNRLETFLGRLVSRPESRIAELLALDASELQLLATWSAQAGGVRVIDADGALVPVGVPGLVWRDGAATAQRGRWSSDGQLQILEAAAPETAAASVSPSGETPARPAALSPTEQVLGKVWCAVLNLPTVRAEDNFFELGGTSLEAMQVAMQLEKLLGKSVDAHQFVMGSLRSIAGGYDTAPVPGHSAQAPAAPAQSASARAAASGAARRLRVSRERGGVMARMAGLFRRNGNVVHLPVAPVGTAPASETWTPGRRAAGPGADGRGGTDCAGSNGHAAPNGARGPAAAPRAEALPLAGDVPGALAAVREALPATAADLQVVGPGGLRRVKHAQPPAPDAFRAPAARGDDALVWVRRDAATGNYEVIGS
jgi:acyl transferase domain-containing protein